MERKEETRYIIELNKEECIGCGSCVVTAPKIFKLSGDGKIDLLKKEITEDELKDVLEAAKICPVNVVHIIDKKTGKKLI